MIDIRVEDYDLSVPDHIQLKDTRQLNPHWTRIYCDMVQMTLWVPPKQDTLQVYLMGMAEPVMLREKPGSDLLFVDVMFDIEDHISAWKRRQYPTPC